MCRYSSVTMLNETINYRRHSIRIVRPSDFSAQPRTVAREISTSTSRWFKMSGHFACSAHKKRYVNADATNEGGNGFPFFISSIIIYRPY